MRNTRNKIGRRAPVAIVGRGRGRVRLREPLDAEPIALPLPGTMLVLLSRLHRAECPLVQDRLENEEPSL